MALYLLLYDKPLGTKASNSAIHYLGYASDRRLKARLKEHILGTWMEKKLGRKPPAIPKEHFKRGNKFKVVWVEYNKGREDERRLKKQGHYKRLYMLDKDGENGTSREFKYLRDLKKHSPN